ncbi:hypothetical protein EUGRSUZ_D00569 [Eucalyptus grandis]|uniref:Uncharacterized protein n=2 Tax=Eucalyptus grandis TaxID=71139 RepID=A0ACC3L3G0_EUCGR|nr:hypothetical protein EUGRSUZ_D00569 [Eucalyptus grandis]
MDPRGNGLSRLVHIPNKLGHKEIRDLTSLVIYIFQSIFCIYILQPSLTSWIRQFLAHGPRLLVLPMRTLRMWPSKKCS